jgi:hypothetical protein
MSILIEKIKAAFEMNDELFQVLQEEHLKLELGEFRSNNIGSQLYCVAAARDCYGHSIMEDKPFNWAPSMGREIHTDKSLLESYCIDNGVALINWLKHSTDKLSENQEELLFDLVAHEYMHQGQLIRYIYANELHMPHAMKAFWHLED